VNSEWLTGERWGKFTELAIGIVLSARADLFTDKGRVSFGWLRGWHLLARLGGLVELWWCLEVFVLEDVLLVCFLDCFSLILLCTAIPPFGIYL
jgi:hypothetical protein